jgi:hypothetical protein
MKDYQCYLRFNTVSRTEFKDLMMSWHYLFKNKYEVVTLFSSAWQLETHHVNQQQEQQAADHQIFAFINLS